jgi:hypothetical protein
VVALATMTTTAMMAWVDDFVHKRHSEIGKRTRWHLTEFLLFNLSLFFRSKAREQC